MASLRNDQSTTLPLEECMSREVIEERMTIVCVVGGSRAIARGLMARERDATREMLRATMGKQTAVAMEQEVVVSALITREGEATAEVVAQRIVTCAEREIFALLYATEVETTWALCEVAGEKITASSISPLSFTVIGLSPIFGFTQFSIEH